MAKLFFSLAFVLLSIHFMMSCGNTENTAEATTEAVMDEAQQAVSNAENVLKEKTKGAEASTYKTAADIKQAIESLQTDMDSEIESLKAELNGASEEAAQVINKKISFYQKQREQLVDYLEKSNHISDTDTPEFGEEVAALVNNIRRRMVSMKKEK